MRDLIARQHLFLLRPPHSAVTTGLIYYQLLAYTTALDLPEGALITTGS